MRRVAVALACCLLLAGCSRLVRLEPLPLPTGAVAAPEQSLVYAADGSLIATLRFANRVNVERGDIPQVLVDAVLAAEDRRFYDHAGVDLRAVARAAVANQRAGQVVQGGSTLTQQLVKNRYFPDAAETLERKSAEARLALALERDATKDEILTDYLNTVYLGEGAYGIQAAARHYFGTDAAELTLPQAALLAGQIRSPERTAPREHPRAATAARRRVLDAMVAAGVLADDEAAAAAAAPLGVTRRPPAPTTRFPYFVEYVKRTLLADPTFGPDEAARARALFGGGLRIHTTIDPALQARAEAAARAHLSRRSDPEVAIAVVRPGDGRLLAAVGGRDFGRLQFDLATQAHRQPGSAFKTFALVAALRSGMRLDDLVDSGSAVLSRRGGRPPWQVASATSGLLPLDRATALSSNGVFARLAVRFGGPRIAEQAEAMGVVSRVGSNEAIALGGTAQGVTPLEMASAYATLANAGVHVPVTAVTRITDAAGREVWRPEVAPRIAMDPETAYLTTQALRRVVQSGTGTAARIGRPAAGKTGTSQDYRDAWFVGYTPQLAASVWVGYPRTERPMLGVRGVARVEGGTFPARIWSTFMAAALAGEPTRQFPYPDIAAVTVRIDPESGLLAAPWCGPGVKRTALPKELPVTTCPSPPPPPPSPEPEPSPEPPPTPAAEPSPKAQPKPRPSATPEPAPSEEPSGERQRDDATGDAARRDGDDAQRGGGDDDATAADGAADDNAGAAAGGSGEAGGEDDGDAANGGDEGGGDTDGDADDGGGDGGADEPDEPAPRRKPAPDGDDEESTADTTTQSAPRRREGD